MKYAAFFCIYLFICFFEQKHLSLQNTSKDAQPFHLPRVQTVVLCHGKRPNFFAIYLCSPVTWKQENNFLYWKILGSKCYLMVAWKGNVNKFYTLFCLSKPKQGLGYVSLTLKKRQE